VIEVLPDVPVHAEKRFAAHLDPTARRPLATVHNMAIMLVPPRPSATKSKSTITLLFASIDFQRPDDAAAVPRRMRNYTIGVDADNAGWPCPVIAIGPV
jgi:hypothetical protein